MVDIRGSHSLACTGCVFFCVFSFFLSWYAPSIILKGFLSIFFFLLLYLFLLSPLFLFVFCLLLLYFPLSSNYHRPTCTAVSSRIDSQKVHSVIFKSHLGSVRHKLVYSIGNGSVTRGSYFLSMPKVEQYVGKIKAGARLKSQKGRRGS